MDSEIFTSAPRWKILEFLAKRPSSPLEIASGLESSVAYASQQLKLLEVAGLIGKQKVKNAQKGKPRVVYSLRKEIVHITALLYHTPTQQTLSLTPHQRIILRIWLLDAPHLHHSLEKLFWLLESDIAEIDAISVVVGPNTKVTVVSTIPKIMKRVQSLAPTFSAFFGLEALYRPTFVPKEGEYALYDPHSLILGVTKGIKA